MFLTDSYKPPCSTLRICVAFQFWTSFALTQTLVHLHCIVNIPVPYVFASWLFSEVEYLLSLFIDVHELISPIPSCTSFGLKSSRLCFEEELLLSILSFLCILKAYSPICSLLLLVFELSTHMHFANLYWLLLRFERMIVKYSRVHFVWITQCTTTMSFANPSTAVLDQLHCTSWSRSLLNCTSTVYVAMRHVSFVLYLFSLFWSMPRLRSGN